MDVMPLVDRGRLAAKATVGEPFPVTATVFREGHDKLGAEVVLLDPTGTRRAPVRMEKEGEEPDRWIAWVTPDAEGAWSFEVHAWSDPLATWQHAAGLKIPAGVDVDLMFTEGGLLLERVLAGLDAADVRARELVQGGLDAAADTTRPVEARLATLEADDLSEVLRQHPLRELVTVEGPFPAYADRSLALYGSWYEFFPRSEGATVDPRTGRATSGTFTTAAKRLDAVAAMGFDVIYLPPIHPIGEVNRKGPNNTLTPEPHDTGSPWAIGSKDGGHDAVHPDLGTIDDFDAFVERATELGLEVALDLALQTRPGPPLGHQPPGVVHHPRRRHHRVRREPSQEVPGHLPGQLRQRPRRHLRRGAADRPPLDGARRPGLPRRQPPHQAGRRSGSGCCARSARPTPTSSSCPRRSPDRR